MFKRDIIVLQNTSFTNNDRDILSIINKAGYQKLTPVQQKVIPPILEGKDIAVATKDTKGKTAAIILPLLKLIDARGTNIKAVIVTPEASIVKKVERQFKLFTGKLSSSLKIASVGCEKNIKKELSLVHKKIDILSGTASRIIDHLRRDNISLADIQTAVVYQGSRQMTSEFTKDIQFIFSKVTVKPQVILFSPRITEEDISALFLKKPAIIAPSEQNQQSQETNQMSLNEDTVKRAIETILERIKVDEDPDILNNYKKYVRKYVPFALKSYFAAYLLKKSLGSHPADQEETTTLFVSIGKNRKVFPRDLSRLFVSALKIDRTKIGGIKVLDNYSFIEVPVTEAERAITLLNGSDFRGRKIAVNHARKKEE